MSNTDEGLRQYLDPRSKYAGYEIEVSVEIRHNEDSSDEAGPDWRSDFSRTYYGDEAIAVMRAIALRGLPDVGQDVVSEYYSRDEHDRSDDGTHR